MSPRVLCDFSARRPLCVPEHLNCAAFSRPDHDLVEVGWPEGAAANQAAAVSKVQIDEKQQWDTESKNQISLLTTEIGSAGNIPGSRDGQLDSILAKPALPDDTGQPTGPLFRDEEMESWLQFAMDDNAAATFPPEQWNNSALSSLARGMPAAGLTGRVDVRANAQDKVDEDPLPASDVAGMPGNQGSGQSDYSLVSGATPPLPAASSLPIDGNGAINGSLLRGLSNKGMATLLAHKRTGDGRPATGWPAASSPPRDNGSPTDLDNGGLRVKEKQSCSASERSHHSPTIEKDRKDGLAGQQVQGIHVARKIDSAGALTQDQHKHQSSEPQDAHPTQPPVHAVASRRGQPLNFSHFSRPAALYGRPKHVHQPAGTVAAAPTAASIVPPQTGGAVASANAAQEAHLRVVPPHGAGGAVGESGGSNAGSNSALVGLPKASYAVDSRKASPLSHHLHQQERNDEGDAQQQGHTTALRREGGSSDGSSPNAPQQKQGSSRNASRSPGNGSTGGAGAQKQSFPDDASPSPVVTGEDGKQEAVALLNNRATSRPPPVNLLTHVGGSVAVNPPSGLPYSTIGMGLCRSATPQQEMSRDAGHASTVTSNMPAQAGDDEGEGEECRQDEGEDGTRMGSGGGCSSGDRQDEEEDSEEMNDVNDGNRQTARVAGGSDAHAHALDQAVAADAGAGASHHLAQYVQYRSIGNNAYGIKSGGGAAMGMVEGGAARRDMSFKSGGPSGGRGRGAATAAASGGMEASMRLGGLSRWKREREEASFQPLQVSLE